MTLQNVQNEKYGRILADVYLDELHINKWLIDIDMIIWEIRNHLI